MESKRLKTLKELREKLEDGYLNPAQLLKLVEANYKFLNYDHHTIEYARISDDLEAAIKSKSKKKAADRYKDALNAFSSDIDSEIMNEEIKG